MDNDDVCVWGSGDLGDAVHLPVPRASVPGVFAAVWPATRAHGGRVAWVAGGVALLGAPPVSAGAILDGTDAMTWMRAVNPAGRLHYTPLDEGGGRFRLTNPAMGHDLVWLVRTRGQWTAQRIQRAMDEELRFATVASVVEAMAPDEQEYEEMVMVRLPHRGALTVLRDLVAAQGGVGVDMVGMLT